MWRYYGYSVGANWRMSLLINLLMEYWMVDDTSLSNNDSIILMVYLILRLKTLNMSCMSTTLFDSRLIGLEVLDLAQPIIESGSQPYEGY